MKKIMLLIVLLVSGLAYFFSNKEKYVPSFDVNQFIQRHPVGTDFTTFKKSLDDVGVKYFIDDRINLELTNSKDLTDEVEFELGFSVNRHIITVKGVAVQEMDLVDVRFNKESKVISYKVEKAYK